MANSQAMPLSSRGSPGCNWIAVFHCFIATALWGLTYERLAEIGDRLVDLSRLTSTQAKLP